MNDKVLALDLEGTLISNAMSQIPRPGLMQFLISVEEMFKRVVIFTTISEHRFRPIANLLVAEGSAPQWFSEIEYIHWSGETKKLEFIPNSQPDECILVDDYEGYIHQGQEKFWLKIQCFESPYLDDDELVNTLNKLKERK